MSKILNAEEMTIGEYLALSDNKSILNIPFSQRPYVWGKKEITRFWDDLVNVYNKSEEQHILNFFTLYGEGSNGSLFIYDGQQRSVTSVVFLCAISNIYNDLYINTNEDCFKSGHDHIKEHYIIQTPRFGVNKGNKHITIRFDDNKLNEFFEKYIIEGGFEEKKIDFKNETEKNLLQTYQFFKNRIKNLIDAYSSNDEKASILDEVVDTLLSKFIIVVLTTKDKSIAERMFNSLNTAGKELDIFYIIKNECVAILGDEKVKSKWMDIELNLADLSKDKFITYYSNVYYGKISKNDDIVDKLRCDNIMDELSTENFIERLWMASKWYAFCRNSENDDLFDDIEVEDCIIKNIKLSIDILNSQQITSYIPVILAMVLNKYNVREIYDVFVEIENLMIRNKTIMGQTAQIFNNFYTDLAYEISKYNLCQDRIIQNINDKKVNDKEIRDILLMPFKRKSCTLRTILIELIDMECKDVKTRSDISLVNLEHVAPKTISDLWKKDSGDDIEEYIHHIGNLTLISTPKNSSLKNKIFIQKKKVYKDSNIRMTREIGESDLDVWNKDYIINRSKHISELILKRWPRNL